jgi:NitT/TauT family transport system substrate-binding protein
MRRLKAARYKISACLLLLGSLVCINPSFAQDTVRVGVGVDPVYTAWWIAKDKGFFAKHNINAEVRQFSGGPDLADATMAGEVDFGASGTATWMPRFVRSDALNILAIQCTSLHAYNVAALTSIKTLEDLKGKKVGTVGGSTTDYLWSLVTKKLGIPENGLNLVSVPPPELVPALDRGDVQAFFSWEPWPSKAVEVSGKDKVHILASSGDIGYFLYFIVVANKALVENKPDVAVRTLAAVRDAIAYMEREPAEAIKSGAERNRLTPELSKKIIDVYKWNLAPSDPQMVERVKIEEAWMRGKERLRGGPINWEKIINSSLLERANKIP